MGIFFDPTPKLKSSPVPISFICFNNNKDECSRCGSIYSKTLSRKQKYCKKCLLDYLSHINDNNTYLDVHISTNNIQCDKHETSRDLDFCTRKIQEWCDTCSEISYFNQIVTHSFFRDYEEQTKIINSLETCILCEKSINLQIGYLTHKIVICSDCYLISSEWIESTSMRKFILYVPWWDDADNCRVCYKDLKFISDSQKWCSHCYAIYIGCRYCLTTNIIFGITNRSQCRKCKKIITIDISDINSDTNEFLHSTRINIDNCYQIANCINNADKISNPIDIYNVMKNELRNTFPKPIIKRIPYSKITGLKKIAEGGFGIIYKAIQLDDWNNKTTVAIKKLKFSNSQDRDFLHELKSLHQCCGLNLINCRGITQDPKTKECMLIMDYADGGNLHEYLQTNFKNISWKEKIHILQQISHGLESIHKKDFIHRDFHSGNILLSEIDALYSQQKWKIGDLGLSRHANNILSNDEIYGIIPYIAPEILKSNGSKYSKASDIYSFGMVMWELTTGCQSFADIRHDSNLIYEIIDGKRPEITSDTPECFSDLMKRCWDPDPLKRPSITEIEKTASYWLYWWNIYFRKLVKQFEKADEIRLELIKLKKLGPEKSSSISIYTSKPIRSLLSNSLFVNPHPKILLQEGTREYELDINNSSYLLSVINKKSNKSMRSLISKSSSMNSASMVSFYIKQKYITREYEFDINNTQSISSSIYPQGAYTSNSKNLPGTKNANDNSFKIEEISESIEIYILSNSILVILICVWLLLCKKCSIFHEFSAKGSYSSNYLCFP